MRRVLGAALVLGALVLLPLPARAQTSSVEIQDNYYVPPEVTVPLGNDVTWTVIGNNAHSVLFDNGIDSNPNCNSITDPLQQQCMHHGDQVTITFNTAGRFAYHCRVHGTAMSGTVFVESGDESSSSSSSSSATSTTVNASSSTDSSSSSASESPLSQAPAPTFTITSTTRVALPSARVTVHDTNTDDVAPWVFADVAIAGTTVIVGTILVRKGRVPFG